ncbi:hypothetical protein HT746_28380 [Burkholderia pyrrocinia]|uniref:hypothetical protein n=1 Tax=Burkholderia pyrrocinia TaxID=60550 RepID=UPI0015758D52|nr:hypothetical protein [Burkholderia pyrrocinia]NTX30988.1 hypothetical protein [Burkholderia pyrrocinia]QVN22603.1 hypothetical protein JYG32_25030 [Burkholderia pyrrocinia]
MSDAPSSLPSGAADARSVVDIERKILCGRLALARFVSVGQRNNADGWPAADMLGFLSNNSGDCYAVHLRKR